ncbi:MAG: TonB family protein [Bacteroidia bacterium]
MLHKLTEVLAQEKRHQRTSLIITAVIVLLFIVLGLLWSGNFSLLPPPGEEAYEVVGAVDFGDGKMGSRDVNTKQEAVPDPTPDPAPAKPAPSTQPEPTPQPTPPKPAADPVVTQTDPTPVTTPKPDPKPKPKPTTTTPKPTQTKPNTKPDDGKASQEVKTDPKPNTTPKPGGSNQGDANTGTGNAGTPAAEINPNFQFSFNPGGGGGGGARRPIALGNPVYNTQQEAKLKFEFVIAPNGRVATVKLVGLTNKLDLKRAGINAIRKWRFDPIPSNQPQNNQTAQVEITFKLK